MKMMRLLRGTALGLVLAVQSSQAQVTVTDDFSSSVNYLSDGLKGTFWDGVYFGSGEFDNTAGGMASTGQCDANISTRGALTLQTTGTEWEGTGDDGFFVFHVVPGDFPAVVEINTPFNNAAYNTAGLQARAFSANGNPYAGSENFVSWTRFDEYNFANYLRNEVDGGVDQINPGDYTIMANAVDMASGALLAGQDTIIQLPVQANANLAPETFSISY